MKKLLTIPFLLTMLYFPMALFGQGLRGNIEAEGFKAQEADKNGVLQWALKGEKAKRRGSILDLKIVELEFYLNSSLDLKDSKDNAKKDSKTAKDPKMATKERQKVVIKSPSCLYNIRRGIGKSKDRIKVTSGDMVLKGEDYEFNVNKKIVVIKRNARLELKGSRNLSVFNRDKKPEDRKGTGKTANKKQTKN